MCRVDTGTERQQRRTGKYYPALCGIVSALAESDIEFCRRN